MTMSTVPRRKFLVHSAVATLGLTSKAFAQGLPRRSASRHNDTIKVLTHGPKHHFFGYYGICPWNQSGRQLVCLECDAQDRMPRAGEAASIGLVDADSGRFTKVAETRAWNLQQGAMLHWNPCRGDEEIIYNDLVKGKIASVVLDIHSGAKRILPGPVSALSRDGKWALSLTYGRMGRLRKVVGYGAAEDPNPDDPAPANDGVFLMDLRTGKKTLIVTIADVYERLAAKHPALRGHHMWFNHTVFNKSATRFLFFARAYLSPGKRRHTAMFTAVRCDFHPRWNRTGDQICFDAIEPVQGTRQLHVASLKG